MKGNQSNQPHDSSAPLGFEPPDSSVEGRGSSADCAEVRRSKSALIGENLRTVEPRGIEYGRQGDDTRPYCGLHFCLMASSGSKGAVTNYRCPVKGCNETAKRARPRDVVPRTPQLCPNCAPKPVACEVDRARSTPYTFKLVCPTCRWSVNVNRPDLAARAARAHRAEHDDLSAR